jgi:hypothetical protein
VTDRTTTPEVPATTAGAARAPKEQTSAVIW